MGTSLYVGPLGFHLSTEHGFEFTRDAVWRFGLLFAVRNHG